MNNLPDISGNDSAELKRLCEQSAKEVKLIGSVSAATSLEMIAHMRSLEIQLRASPAKDSAVVSPETAQLVDQWRATLMDESKVTDEDAEDLMFRIIAFANRGVSLDTKAQVRKIVAGCSNWHDIQYTIVPRIISALSRRSAGYEDGVKDSADIVKSIADRCEAESKKTDNYNYAKSLQMAALSLNNSANAIMQLLSATTKGSDETE